MCHGFRLKPLVHHVVFIIHHSLLNYLIMFNWLQILIETPASLVEPISDALTTAGALSVSWQDAQDQPLYEPALNTTPVWKETRVVGLFEGQTDLEKLLADLQTSLAPLSLPAYQVQWLEDQDWCRVCQKEFQPLRFGSRLWICPSWETPPDPTAVNVLLDPGLAFGTGTHPTTALCLEWLDQHSEKLAGQTLIDYGCGSGILAIAAVKLGASQVWAVDMDPQAVFATGENAQKNAVAANIQAVLPDQLPTLLADGLLANILANPLISLASTFANYLKPGAWLVLSGILKEQAGEVEEAYRRLFDIMEVVERDGWVRMVAVKNEK